MNRKDFMKKTCGLELALALAGTVKAQTEEKKTEEKGRPRAKIQGRLGRLIPEKHGFAI